MSQPPPQQLQYAQHHERRVPMYAIVLSILAATFLLFMGALLTVGCVAIIWRGVEQAPAALISLLIIAPFGIIFLLSGIAQLAGTIRQLRGTVARATTMERAFRLLNTDFSSQTYEDRFR